MIETTHAKLVAVKTGIYTIYVFQKDNLEYVMCTKLPNWGVYDIKIGDSGFLTYEFANAGEEYFDRDTNERHIYKFTNVYFKDFIKDNENRDEIIL
jgi:hypothetical protein